ncbi:hypothetical protein RFI_28687 [Reticulomyxa filosa]|uniref:Endonuclease/exonuclease/phosphatase domain-containing protein n=1 Tax=Reticulomyxa filosa TaxID=46433 RepID=X6M440_RETFI|nr:hypothetical protein RFI_28687 [Reticulomyxa filosa]|eukprot:ETO08699.1 hypothetical protein RFI_28687 [Reticulomyxa filosa]
MYLYFNVKVLVENIYEIVVKINQRQQLSVENKKIFDSNYVKKRLQNVKDYYLQIHIVLANIARVVNINFFKFASCEAFNNNRNRKCFVLNHYNNECTRKKKCKYCIKLKNCFYKYKQSKHKCVLCHEKHFSDSILCTSQNKQKNNNQNEEPNCWSKISKEKYTFCADEIYIQHKDLLYHTKINSLFEKEVGAIKKITKFIVINGDWNANHQIWSNEKIDNIVEVVVDFIVQNGLRILQYNLLNHNLEKNDGKSSIDISLCSNYIDNDKLDLYYDHLQTTFIIQFE